MSRRKLTRQEFLLMGAGVGAGLVVAGCGGGPQNNPAVQGQSGGNGGKSYDGPKVELNYWNGYTGPDGSLMRRLVEQFSSEHKNIDVKMNIMEWESYYQKAPTAVNAGTGPDVGISHEEMIGTLAARGAIAPLDDVANALNLEADDIASAVWKSEVYNDQRYGIPLSLHPLGFYYNKGLMEQAGLDPDKPPQNRDDYMAALEELKGAGIKGHWVSPFLFTGGLSFESLLWQFGGQQYNDSFTKALFDSDAGVEALTWLVDLVKEGYSPRNVGQDAETVAFQNNKNAFLWNGIWNIPAFPEVENLEWGAAPLPLIGTQKAAWSSSSNFVLFNQRSQDPNRLQASKVFINWMVEHSVEWSEAGNLPAVKSALDEPGFENQKWPPVFAKQVDYLHFPPIMPGIVEVSTESWIRALNEAVLLEVEPSVALEEAAGRAEELLAENREKYAG